MGIWYHWYCDSMIHKSCIFIQNWSVIPPRLNFLFYFKYLCSNFLQVVDGHAIFWEPPSRASLGKHNKNLCNVPENDDHMSLWCGSRDVSLTLIKQPLKILLSYKSYLFLVKKPLVETIITLGRFFSLINISLFDLFIYFITRIIVISSYFFHCG